MNELIVYSKWKDFISYIDLYVFSSFPKYKLSLKIKFEQEMYGLLENITKANVDKATILDKNIWLIV